MAITNIPGNPRQSVPTCRSPLLGVSPQVYNSMQIQLGQLPSIETSQRSDSIRERSFSNTSKSQFSYRERLRKRTSIRVLEQQQSGRDYCRSREEDVDFRSSLLGEGEEDGKKKGGGGKGYDMWDLTSTLITTKIPIGVVSILFAIFVLIRYYTFACLIYMAINSNMQEKWWLCVVVADRMLFVLLVIKISLQVPETRTQIALKSHWNSKQSQISQYFQVINRKKLLISIIRGIIPAQLSFIYINSSQRGRKFQLYTAINYINCSIQAVIYYPFFILYCYFLTTDHTFSGNPLYRYLTLGLACLAEFFMICGTVGLICVGVRRKCRERRVSE